MAHCANVSRATCARYGPASKGEKQAAYLIDFDYGPSKNFVVIHDLRLSFNGRVAQIDHLLINRVLDVLVLETKHFHAGVKITANGEFMRWNKYRKCYEGMSSPLEQNQRHISVLREVFDRIPLPRRLGLTLRPTFHSYVLISPDARIDREKGFDSSAVIKADTLGSTWDAAVDSISPLSAIGKAGKLLSLESVADVGQRLIALHRPLNRDEETASAQAGTSPTEPATVLPLETAASPSPTAEPVQSPKPDSAPTQPAEAADDGSAPAARCRHCHGENVRIEYGRYGYYFKCLDCAGNTSIRLDCSVAGHKERLRKQGAQFFRECAGCGSRQLFFTNEPA